MNRGPNVSGVLPALARSRGFSQAKLEEATGIGHSTMSRYWSGRGGLGLTNGRRIADVLEVELSELGLSEDGLHEEALLRRLESLAVEAERGRSAVIAALVSIDERLSRIERSLGLQAPQAQAGSGA